jgi:hypothetical protein
VNSPYHDAGDSASDTDSETDHSHSNYGVGVGSDDSSSTFEHSHSSISSVSAMSGDSSDDHHYHEEIYYETEEESYDHRTYILVDVDSQVSFLVDIEEEFTDIEEYQTHTDYSVDV